MRNMTTTSETDDSGETEEQRLSKSARKHSVKLNLKEDYYTQLQEQGLSLSFPIARAHTLSS